MSRSNLINSLILFPVFTLLTALIPSLAQSVKVVDATTLQSIPDVGIFNLEKNKFSQTNEEGEADLSMFGVGEILEFQHPSYKNQVFPLHEVLMAGTLRMSEEIIHIDEVIISASKFEQLASEVPQSVVAITPNDINFYHSQTAADALGITGQVFIQKSQLGGGSPMIRGFAASSVLVAIDGVRMNNAIFRSGNLQNVINIDPNIIEKAEVVLGPGSVLYGSDALGGVMNFSVKEPGFASSESMLIKSTGYLRYSSANNEQTGHIQFNLGGRKFSWLSSFTYSKFDHLRTGSKRTDEFPNYGKRLEYVVRRDDRDVIIKNADENLQVFSGYNAFNTIQRFKLRPSTFFDITYSLYYSTTSDIPRYDRLIVSNDSIPASSVWNYGPQEWMMNALQFSFYNKNSFFNEMHIVLANQQFGESRIDRKFQDPFRRERTENVDVWTLNIDIDKEIDEHQKLFYGFEGVYNKVGSRAETMDIETGVLSKASTRYPDGGSTLGNVALYGSYQNKFRDRWMFSSGIRYSYLILNSLFSDTTFYKFPFDEITINTGAITGNLSLVYSTKNNWIFDFLLGSGFRAPNVDDIGKVFDSEPGNVVVPNEDLKPEYAYNAEIGFTKTIPAFMKLNIVGFYTRLVDTMVRRDFTVDGQDSIIYDGTLSKVEALVNVGKAYIAGITVDLKLDLAENLSFTSTLTVMNGLDTEDDLPLRHVTPTYGRSGVEFRGNNFRAELFARYQASKAFKDLAPSEQAKNYLYTPDGALGWSTLNVNTSWQPNPIFQLSAALENILNQHYRPYSSGISSPGRNFMLSVKISI